MTKVSLKSKKRDVSGSKVKKFRKDGLIPAVIYGHKVKPQNLWVDYVDFKKVFGQAGENTIVELEIDGKEKSGVLIHDVQNDPIDGKTAHVDFFKIRMDEKIETEVPIEFIGESPSVKEQGGIFVKNMDKLPISCLPIDLPSKIEADISTIKTYEDHLKIKDLKIPENVEVKIDIETVVALTKPPRSEEELESLDEKVEEDVTKVEGVVKEEAEGEEGETKEEKTAEEKTAEEEKKE